MKLNNKKILGGVISLLAIVSVVNTQAIVKIAKRSNLNESFNKTLFSSEDQTAQVASALNNCLTVNKNWGLMLFWDDQLPVTHTYHLDVLIKNNCSEKVYILGQESFNPHSLNNYPAGYVSPYISLRSGWGTLYNDPFITNLVDPNSYQVVGDWSNPGVNWLPSNVGNNYLNNQSLLSIAGIMPGETKQVGFVFSVESTPLTRGFTLISLDRIKYIKESALDGDYFVTANEIRTKKLTGITTDMIWGALPSGTQMNKQGILETKFNSLKDYKESFYNEK